MESKTNDGGKEVKKKKASNGVEVQRYNFSLQDWLR
jgi:hypothetical protein